MGVEGGPAHACHHRSSAATERFCICRRRGRRPLVGPKHEMVGVVMDGIAPKAAAARPPQPLPPPTPPPPPSQVEHPVTEMITGVDHIQEQIRAAQGETLRFKQEDIVIKGHAIECRLNAEDPFKNFRPGPGRVIGYLPPGGPHVRMDSHLYPDYLVPPNYDSLLGKLIVWGEDRTQAIARMKRALTETVISGVPTTTAYHLLILEVPDFVAGDVDTGFIPKHAAELQPKADGGKKKENIVEIAAKRAAKRAKSRVVMA